MKASQVIDFPVLDPVPFGGPITLSAFGGGSANSVTFSIVSGPGTVNGDTLTFTGIGSVIVEADEAGNADYNAAPAVQRTIVVTPAYQATASENENSTPTAITVSTVLGSHLTDADGSKNTKPGIAVFQTSGNGTWQYSINGVTWIVMSSLSQASALPLPASDLLRFVPVANSSGQANLFFVAWDGSQGTAGSFFNITSTGGATPFSTNAGSLLVTVNPVPLWTGNAAVLPSIPANTSSPAGNSVNAVFGNYFRDDNPAVSVGVALVSATGTASGTWEFSTDGTSWTSFGTAKTTFGVLSTSNAILLSASDRIRFVPNAGFAGTATLQAYAWDGTQGTTAVFGATKGFKITATGGASGFSTTLLTASCLVNDAPTLGVATGPTLPTAIEGVASTVTVNTLIKDAQVSDADAKALQGIAIVGVGGTGQWPGNWQYSLNGVSWTNLPIVSEASAFLLPGTASLRFVAKVQADNATSINPATLTYRAWDQTAGTAGKAFAVTATGGATSISSTEVTASVPVNFVNHAPTWLTSVVSLAAVQPGITPEGSTVGNVFGAYFNDADGNSVGVAVVGVAGTTGGSWQYSTDGTNWTGFGTTKATFGVPSTSNALLLSASDQIRFVPNASFAGTATLQAYAWDGTQGTTAVFGATKGFKITATGGASGFNTMLLTVSCLVNDAPTLGAATGPTLPTAIEGVPSTVTVSTLIKGAQVSDADAKALQGIAIVGVGGTGQWPGNWQYSLNGVSWTNLPIGSEASAFLLPSTASLRFVAKVQADNATSINPATLTYRAWDQTAGTAGKASAVTATGGATSISSTEVTANVPVNFVNHAPTWVGTGASLPAEQPGITPAGSTVANAFGAYFNDADGNSVGVAVVSATGTTSGTWEFSTDGTSWTSFGTAKTTFGVLSTSNAILLSASDRIRFVPNAGFAGTATLQAYAWDGTQGTTAVFGATKGFKITATGGASGFNTMLLTVSCLVNDALIASAATGSTLPTAIEGVLQHSHREHAYQGCPSQRCRCQGTARYRHRGGRRHRAVAGQLAVFAQRRFLDQPADCVGSFSVLAAEHGLVAVCGQGAGRQRHVHQPRDADLSCLGPNRWDGWKSIRGDGRAASATSISSTEVTASVPVNFR